MKRVAAENLTPRANILLWIIAFVIAVGTVSGLLWLGAVIISHMLGISVKDALIRMLTAY